MNTFKLALLAGAAVITTGCASIGHIKGQSTNTVVNLSESNYQIVKTEVKGDSKGFFLLGILPFRSPTYHEAKASLYRAIGSPLENRSVAFANQTEDISSQYFILFSIPKVTLTADLVEFKNSTNP